MNPLPPRDAPALAIFGRAPVPGKAKTRLIPLLGVRGAADFQAALISDTLRKAGTLRGPIGRYFFLAGRNWPPIFLPSTFTLVRQRGADLGGRLGAAFRSLLEWHARAVVIGTDSPLLSRRILREAFQELRVCDAVLGPCPDGGYYLIGLRRAASSLDTEIFRRVRWGSASAFRDTLRNLLRRDFSCSILEPLGDIDRPEDLRQLGRDLACRRGARRLAPSAWRFWSRAPHGVLRSGFAP